MTQCSPLSISLVGRINSIKMTILPKFLYVFRAIPIFIPQSFFYQLDSVISSYIWQGQRPRLQKIKAMGGLVLLNFHFYFWCIIWPIGHSFMLLAVVKALTG